MENRLRNAADQRPERIAVLKQATKILSGTARRRAELDTWQTCRNRHADIGCGPFELGASCADIRPSRDEIGREDKRHIMRECESRQRR